MAIESGIERPDDMTEAEWDLVKPLIEVRAERDRYKAAIKNAQEALRYIADTTEPRKDAQRAQSILHLATLGDSDGSD